MVEEARSFAEKAHEGQFRKGTKRPYIVHPLEVAKIVSTMTDDEEMISAALLHDTLEDCRQVTKEQIKEAFGERVLEMVGMANSLMHGRKLSKVGAGSGRYFRY